MLKKNPEDRIAIDEVIRQPLFRRPLRVFIDTYRPLHVEERARRAQIRELTTQVGRHTIDLK